MKKSLFTEEQIVFALKQAEPPCSTASAQDWFASDTTKNLNILLFNGFYSNKMSTGVQQVSPIARASLTSFF
ncbi:hypothetical protein [Brenneria uluponensis]|uniref:hypothetical protein n=1 Tax=Brenneria uluponensis TaxID=3057057 RepID=UPI003CCC6441